ncbi:hypothetical protein K438DRAFT_1995665 [Mycena galopus ATCC 62051]|nr:hypothetical protein K438DRAFT_1995665 [Mycena galopus ATCC 62051]
MDTLPKEILLNCSAEDAQQLLRFICAYRNICALEEKIAAEKLRNTMAYLQMLRKDIEIAQRKVSAADHDVGTVRAAIRREGFPIVGTEDELPAARLRGQRNGYGGGPSPSLPAPAFVSPARSPPELSGSASGRGRLRLALLPRGFGGLGTVARDALPPPYLLPLPSHPRCRRRIKREHVGGGAAFDPYLPPSRAASRGSEQLRGTPISVPTLSRFRFTRAQAL